VGARFYILFTLLSAVNIHVCSDVAPYKVVNMFRCYEGKYFHLKDCLTTYYFDRSVTIYRSVCCNISAELSSADRYENIKSRRGNTVFFSEFSMLCYVDIGLTGNYLSVSGILQSI
jgi:hypothetical protein